MSRAVNDQPIRAIAAAIRDGKTTAEAIVDEAIGRHDRVGSSLDAYKLWDPDRARAEAAAADTLLKGGLDAGPLMGLPISIKDLYGVNGMPTFAGTPKALPDEWRREGPVVAALREQLGVVMGKTHTDEFAFGGVGTNPHWPIPRNPWDGSHHRACGGSSSGAGVSLCEGSAFVAMGSDTGGSVRIPATVTGNVGLKISIGRWSADGIVPLSTTFDTPGPLTRSVEDSIVAFAVIDPAHDDAEALFQRLDGVAVGDIRIGVATSHFWDDCAPGVAEAVKGALAELEKKGARLADLDLPEAPDAREMVFHRHLFGVEAMSFINEQYPDRLETMDPNVKYRMDISRDVSATEYYTALRQLKALAVRADARLRHVDVFVGPTTPGPVPRLDRIEEPKAYNTANALMTHNTFPINLLEMCAITVPVGLDGDGMPVGLQMVARHGQEERLLAVALACESVLGTPRERLGTPPLCA